MASIEEKVEEYYKAELDNFQIRHYGKTEKINNSISNALKNADSKSGGSGNNFPDIQLINFMHKPQTDKVARGPRIGESMTIGD